MGFRIVRVMSPPRLKSFLRFVDWLIFSIFLMLLCSCAMLLSLSLYHRSIHTLRPAVESDMLAGD